MNGYKRLQKQISKKKRGIQELENEHQELGLKIREAKAFLAGLETSLKHIPSEEKDERSSDSLRAGGSIAKVHEILTENTKPMYIKDILMVMGRNTDADSQKTLTSQLNNYVRQNRIFSRPYPNTYALKEWTDSSPPDNDNGVQASMAIN